MTTWQLARMPPELPRRRSLQLKGKAEAMEAVLLDAAAPLEGGRAAEMLQALLSQAAEAAHEPETSED